MAESATFNRLIVPALRIDKIGIAAARDAAVRLIDDVAPGGFILFGGRAEEVAGLTAELRARSPHRLIISADLERGAGQQFQGLSRIPTPMAIAACAESRAYACLAGRLTAVEALSVGVDLVFAPVCDVSVEPRNPIINVRSFSSDPRIAADLARNWILGAQAAGVLACAKHFPGHGGTWTDSHLELPEGPRNADELRSVHLPPFVSAIEIGVKAIMVAHMTVPAIDDSGLPATLSPRVVTGLLREELGFRGIVITDALIMEGIAKDETEAAAFAIAAGCDLLLYPRDPRRVLEHLRSSDLDPEPALRRLDRARGIDLAAAVADQCVTLEAGAIVRPDRFLIIHDDDRLDPAPFREACLRAGWSEVESASPESSAAAEDAERIVTAVFAMPGAWRGRSGPASGVLARVPTGSGVVAFGDPYFLRELPSAGYRIAAYDDHPLTQRAVVRHLLGEGVPSGTLPVR
jgi:beta-glucosidase-like glycosyl hydrolase